MTEQRRTKRRYAHELYPHGGEFEIRPLAVEVPYLYARAIGLQVWSTGWFDRDKEALRRSGDRTMLMIDARQRALLADALLQGLAGQEAWEWAESRMDEAGEFIYEQAVLYGIDPKAIKPYPCGPEPQHHDHTAPSDRWPGVNVLIRVEGRESDCPDCTEEVPTDSPAPAATPPVPQAVAGTVEPTAAPATRTDNGGAS